MNFVHMVIARQLSICTLSRALVYMAKGCCGAREPTFNEPKVI